MLKVSEPVLVALRSAVLSADSVSLGSPDDAPLERAVLESCGAKWNRRRKAHVFTDAWDADMWADVCESGEAPPKNPLAFFPTPRAVAESLLDTAPCCV